MKGFPDVEVIKPLIEQYLTFPKRRILKIEYINNEQFNKLKRQISATGYDIIRVNDTSKQILEVLKRIEHNQKTIINMG